MKPIIYKLTIAFLIIISILYSNLNLHSDEDIRCQNIEKYYNSLPNDLYKFYSDTNNIDTQMMKDIFYSQCISIDEILLKLISSGENKTWTNSRGEIILNRQLLYFIMDYNSKIISKLKTLSDEDIANFFYFLHANMKFYKGNTNFKREDFFPYFAEKYSIRIREIMIDTIKKIRGD